MLINLTLESFARSFFIGSRGLILFVMLMSLVKLRKSRKAKDYKKSMDYKQAFVEGIGLLFMLEIALAKEVLCFVNKVLYNFVETCYYNWCQYERDLMKMQNIEIDIKQTKAKIDRMVRENEPMIDVVFFERKLMDKEIELEAIKSKYKK